MHTKRTPVFLLLMKSHWHSIDMKTRKAPPIVFHNLFRYTNFASFYFVFRCVIYQ